MAITTTTAPEFPKFTAALLLIHGRWCGPAVWHRFSGYCAHLGWTCHLTTLRGHGDGEDPATTGGTFADHVEDLRRAIAACSAPPILVGHDVGGLLALHCAAGTRAVVALAPTLPRALAGSRSLGLRTRLAIWRRGPVVPPAGHLGTELFGAGIPGGQKVESRPLLRQLFVDNLMPSQHPGIPKLIMVGEADPVCRPSDGERLAQHVGADCLRLEGAGHAMAWNTGWEKCVVRMHRWLVQQLGESLLLPQEEDA